MSTPTVHNLGFGFDGIGRDGRLDWARETTSVRDVIMNILLTRPGERLMRPEFGAGLGEYLHRPNNQTTRQLIADVALRAIQRWEPRIEVDKLRVDSHPEHLNQLILSIHYRLLHNGQSEQLDLNLNLG